MGTAAQLRRFFACLFCDCPGWITKLLSVHREKSEQLPGSVEVNNLKPFACLAFQQSAHLKTPRKQSIFGDELVTSFLRVSNGQGFLPEAGLPDYS
jgi:hypothetical protein